MRSWLPIVMLLAAASAHAELYKWVDAKGVTNYSSTPPAGQAKVAAAVVQDRVSVIQQDQSWREAAAISEARAAQAQMSADAEWLQRQRLMALKDSYTAVAYPVDDYYPYPYYGYGAYPVYPVARARAVRAVLPVATPRGVVVRGGASRGMLVR